MAAASTAGAQIVIEKVEQCLMTPTSYHACVLFVSAAQSLHDLYLINHFLNFSLFFTQQFYILHQLPLLTEKQNLEDVECYPNNAIWLFRQKHPHLQRQSLLVVEEELERWAKIELNDAILNAFHVVEVN